MRRYGLRFVALFYLAAILIAPLGIVFYRTFEDGFRPAWEALSTPETIHAFKLTLLITAIAVPLNTVFGIVCALAIVRKRFPGKGLLNAFIDLPLALSPVVVGLSLFLLYGRTGWFGGFFERHDIQFLFALPAMVVATIFVSLPFVAREVVPMLREIGDEQEQAAKTLGIPKQTMLIETPIAVLKNSEHKEKANQFIRFTKTVAAQRIWAEYGFRPVNKQVAREFRSKFPGRPTIFRISDPIFGGSWAAADKKWFDPNGSIMVDIEKAIGGPTG